jgi:UDP-N-acetylglucosamine 2-epimerase (non-hydrolysing)/GDP/UDP-N,N'-diacetylbacillosamine 2-epimerase (hydrolysing)
VRTLGVVTVARSDYGIYLPILHRLRADPELRYYLLVAGMHLSPEFGATVGAIEADGFEIGERVEMLLSSETPEGIAKSIGLGVIGFAQAYARRRPDLLVVLGDRFEMFAAALAALPFKIPVAHIHGGDITGGAFDDALRHGMTKLSHLHSTATPDAARRVKQLGEEPWRVLVSGAPALDNLRARPLLTRGELETRFRLRLQAPPLLVTFHPVTLEYEQTAWQMGELLAALEQVDLPVVFTSPNADTHGRTIARLIEGYVRGHPSAQYVGTLGVHGHFSLMAASAAMVGNSSSGLIEASAFELPVVNVGSRQAGRARAANVIDVGYPRDDIAAGIRRAVAPEFRASLRGLVNPYGNGGAAERIVTWLKSVELGDRLIRKVFQEYEADR